MTAEANPGRRNVRDEIAPENRGYIDRVAAMRAAEEARRAQFGTKINHHSWDESVPKLRRETPSYIDPLDAAFPDATTVAHVKAIEAIKAARATHSQEPIVPEELPGARAAFEDDHSQPQSPYFWMNER